MRLIQQPHLTKSGVIGLVNGVPSAILAQAPVIRVVLAFSVGNTTCPISLNTAGGGVELVRLYQPAASGVMGDLVLQLQQADNGLALVAHGADSASVSYTVVYAEPPAMVRRELFRT